MSGDCWDASSFITEPEQSFEEWRESEEHDYHLEASAVLDYANQNVNYADLDAAIEDSADISGVDGACEKLGFHPDSSEAAVVRKHFESYISLQS